MAYPGRPILSRAQSSNYDHDRDRAELRNDGQKGVVMDDDDDDDDDETKKNKINLLDDELSDAQVWRDE